MAVSMKKRVLKYQKEATPLDQFELAQVVGDSAAFMLFGQNGACIGRTFNLMQPNGKSVTVKMTVEGAVIQCS